MDNLATQIKNRPRDPDGRISLRSRYSDRNFVTLEDGIQDRSMEIPRLGIISPPALSVSALYASGLTIWYSDFECLTPYGVKCMIPAGRVGLCAAGLTPRIDVIAVDPLVQYDGDGEIQYSGEVTVVTGLELYDEPNVPHIPSSWLKIGEAGLCAGSCICSLRSYIPDKVPTPMAAPRVGLTSPMKLFVNPFRGHIGCSNQRVDYDGGFSPAFTPPGISGMHRLDLLVMSPGAELEIISGEEVTSPNRPAAPDYPAARMPIAEVYLQDTDDWMHQDMVSDVRPHFTWPVSSGIEWISPNDFARKAAGAPELDFFNLLPVLKFDDALEESAYHSLRIPCKYGAGQGLSATIAWTNVLAASETDAVHWGIEYSTVEPCAGITPSLGNRVGICVSPIDCSGQGQAFLRREARVGLSFSGLNAGAILGLRVYRGAGVTEDTLVGDAALLGLGLEW
ncbi:hypothetical protein ES703_01617 [subsurface metagenome]